MKTSTNYLLTFVSVIFFLCSCDNNILEKESIDNTKSNVSIEKGSISFVYQGMPYSSEYQKKDSTIVYSDKGVDNILKNIASLPNLATYIHENGAVEFFDSYDLMESYLNKIDSTPKIASPTTRAYQLNIVTLTIYQNAKYKGNSVKFTVNHNSPTYGMANLATCGMANAISSIKLNGLNSIDGPIHTLCTVTFYEKINFSGKSISWSVSPSSPDLSVKNFKDVSMNLPPLAPADWNDKANSFRLVLK